MSGLIVDEQPGYSIAEGTLMGTSLSDPTGGHLEILGGNIFRVDCDLSPENCTVRYFLYCLSFDASSGFTREERLKRGHKCGRNPSNFVAMQAGRE